MSFPRSLRIIPTTQCSLSTFTQGATSLAAALPHSRATTSYSGWTRRTGSTGE